jgi:uncharacterized protein
MYSHARIYVMRLKPHQDLKISIEEFTRANKIKAAVIVTAVGSLEQHHIRFANQPGGNIVKGFFEITSLTGIISESGCHLHILVCDNKGIPVGGHLLTENLIYTTAEIALAELPDLEFRRTADPTYGFKELTIHERR